MNTSAAYIVAAACIGYVFCFNCYKFRFSLARKAGYYAYLHCTSFGLVFVFLGVVFKWDWVRVDWLYFEILPKFSLPNELFEDVATSLIIAILSLTIFNLFVNQPKAAALAWKDDLSTLLWKAMELDLPVQITVDTRKVYVGHVYDTPSPDEDSSYLSIVPILSGHRAEDTLQLEITHKYRKVMRDIRAKKASDYDAYQLVIPKSKIVTCHIFDPQIYKETRNDQLIRNRGHDQPLI